MGLGDDETTIRRFLGLNKITPVMPAGARVIPAPVFFNDKADYWATIETVSYETQLDIETEHICFVSFYFKNFINLGGPKDSPVIGLNYELYAFSQYDLERSDENVSPDAFNKKMLLKHNEFTKLVLDLLDEFQGDRNMGVLDHSIYAWEVTTGLLQTEAITNRGVCAFIPDVQGHQCRLQEQVQVQLVAC